MKRKDFIKSIGVVTGAVAIGLPKDKEPIQPKGLDKFAKFDRNNTKLQNGDLLLEYGRGMGISNGNRYYDYLLWEYWGQHDLRGYCYDYKGNMNHMFHAHPKYSVILDRNKLTDDFLYKFNHGCQHITSDIEDGDPYQIINTLRWYF